METIETKKARHPHSNLQSWLFKSSVCARTWIETSSHEMNLTSVVLRKLFLILAVQLQKLSPVGQGVCVCVCECMWPIFCNLLQFQPPSTPEEICLSQRVNTENSCLLTLIFSWTVREGSSFETRAPQWPQAWFLSDKHPQQVTAGTTFLLFISTCAISGIRISAAAGTRQSARYVKNRHGRSGHFRLHARNARTGVCVVHRGFSAFVFSGEQDHEQTGEVKAAEMSQGHFNLKKNKNKPEVLMATCAGITGVGKTHTWRCRQTHKRARILLCDLIAIRQGSGGSLLPASVTSNRSQRLYSRAQRPVTQRHLNSTLHGYLKEISSLPSLSTNTTTWSLSGRVRVTGSKARARIFTQITWLINEKKKTSQFQ